MLWPEMYLYMLVRAALALKGSLGPLFQGLFSVAHQPRAAPPPFVQRRLRACSESGVARDEVRAVEGEEGSDALVLSDPQEPAARGAEQSASRVVEAELPGQKPRADARALRLPGLVLGIEVEEDIGTVGQQP